MVRTDLLPSGGGTRATVLVQKSHSTLQPWHVSDSSPQLRAAAAGGPGTPSGRAGEVTQVHIPQGVLGKRASSHGAGPAVDLKGASSLGTRVLTSDTTSPQQILEGSVP